MELIVLIVLAYFLIKEYKQYKKNKYKKYIIRDTNPPTQSNTKPQIKQEIKEEKKTNYDLYYKPKRYIISLTELKFYKELLEIAKRNNLILLTQVSLYNIIETKQTTYKQTAFNKIRSKSIDFVLADIQTCRARVCIELDDYTHNNLNRIDRDNFLNNLFSDLGIKLMRIPVSKQYDIQKIETEIKNTILACKY